MWVVIIFVSSALILVACQLVWGYFMPTNKEIMFIVHQYYICVVVSKEIFSTQLHGFMNSYLILIIVWFQGIIST